MWRTGRTLGLTLYIQDGNVASMTDRFVGVADTRHLAEVVVAAVNGLPPFPSLPGATSRGRLVYLFEPGDPLTEFSIVMDTPTRATQVVTALTSDSPA